MADYVNPGMANIQHLGNSDTVGSALQAYDISTKAAAARQALEAQKTELAINKSKWVASQMENIGKYDGNPDAQKFLLDSFAKQAPHVIDGFDPDTVELLRKDADTRRTMSKAAAMALQGGHFTEGTLPAIQSAFGSTEGMLKAAQHNRDNDVKIEEARLQAEAAKNRAASFNDRNVINDRNAAERMWNTEFSTTKPTIQRLEGATRIENLIKAAQDGKFKSNKAFLGQINAEVSRLEIGAQNPGLGQSEKTEMESAAAEFGALRDKISNTVTDVNLKAQTDQALGMVREMKQSYRDMGIRKANDLAAGASSNQLPVFQAKMQNFQATYPDNSAPAAAPKPGTQPLPKIGEVQDGHRYKGGNPWDANSWEVLGSQPSAPPALAPSPDQGQGGSQ